MKLKKNAVYRCKNLCPIFCQNSPICFHCYWKCVFIDRLNSETSSADVIVESALTNENENTSKKEENDSACHSRNSSSVSHLSKSHSRQSSSGESGTGHTRYKKKTNNYILYFELLSSNTVLMILCIFGFISTFFVVI